MSRGGHTSTTWKAGSSWRSGETKTIRVPIALEAEIMAFARALDSGVAASQGNTAEMVLNAIAQYIEMRRQNLHPNQHSKGKGLNTESRTWDELRRFQEWVKSQQVE